MKKKNKIDRFLLHMQQKAVAAKSSDLLTTEFVDSNLDTCKESLILQDIIQVNCNAILADLYKKKFGSGSKGSCVRVAGEYLADDHRHESGGQDEEAWMTPIEFEAFCGKGSCRDWKRSIKVGGQPLSKLIDENILICHAISCTCAICNDNEKLTGPIKPFLKAKRRQNSNEIRQAYDKFRSLKPPIFLKNSLVQKLNKLEKLSDERAKATPDDREMSDLAEKIERIEEQEKQHWASIDKAMSSVLESVRSLEALIKESKAESELNMRKLRELMEPPPPRRVHIPAASRTLKEIPPTASNRTRLLVRKIQKKYSRRRAAEMSRNFS